MTVALSCSEFRRYGRTMSSMVPSSKEDDCGGDYVGTTSLCEAFRIASSSTTSGSLRSRNARWERRPENDTTIAPEVAKSALSEALRAAAEVTEIEAAALLRASLAPVSPEEPTVGVIDLAPRRPLRSSLHDDDLHQSEPDMMTVARRPSMDSILKTNTPAAAFKSKSQASVRRQLSFGATDTVEFDASLPACFAIDRPVTRWRSSRRGLERSHSSDCLPRLPARNDRAMLPPPRCGARRRHPEASPRMPQRVAAADDDEAFPFRAGEPAAAILMSPTRTFDSPRSHHHPSPTQTSPRLGLVRMDSA